MQFEKLDGFTKERSKDPLQLKKGQTSQRMKEALESALPYQHKHLQAHYPSAELLNHSIVEENGEYFFQCVLCPIATRIFLEVIRNDSFPTRTVYVDVCGVHNHMDDLHSDRLAPTADVYVSENECITVPFTMEYLEMREVAWTCRLLRKVFLPAVKVGKEVHHHMVLLLDRAFIICAYCGEKCCTEDPAATAEGLFAQFPAHMAQCRYWIECGKPEGNWASCEHDEGILRSLLAQSRVLNKDLGTNPLTRCKLTAELAEDGTVEYYADCMQ